MSDSRGRALLAVAAVVAVLAMAWHASPVALWHLRFESQLSAEGNAERLESPVRSTAAPDPDWSTLRAANFSLRLPLLAGQQARCGDCASQCVLALEDTGTLAVFDAAPPEDLGEARDGFAPDARDLSLLRSVRRNWRTIDALTDRARNPIPPPDSFRYATDRSQGVVSRFRVNGRGRYVVYAYGPAGEPTRVLGVTGVTEERFDRILGGLAVSARPAGETPATCR